VSPGSAGRRRRRRPDPRPEHRRMVRAGPWPRGFRSYTPETDERAVAQRNVAGVAAHDVPTSRADREHERHDEHVLVVEVSGDQRKADQHESAPPGSRPGAQAEELWSCGCVPSIRSGEQALRPDGQHHQDQQRPAPPSPSALIYRWWSAIRPGQAAPRRRRLPTMLPRPPRMTTLSVTPSQTSWVSGVNW